MSETNAIENYCLDCRAVAQADCESSGHIVGTLGNPEPWRTMAQPDYPSRCDSCGQDGTNASLNGHVCPTVNSDVREESAVDLQQGLEDTARLNWLEDFIEGGVVEAGVELDGGIHLTLSAMGDAEPTAFREQESLRDAIDTARAARNALAALAEGNNK